MERNLNQPKWTKPNQTFLYKTTLAEPNQT
jgi:hypothetical protein